LLAMLFLIINRAEEVKVTTTTRKITPTTSVTTTTIFVPVKPRRRPVATTTSTSLGTSTSTLPPTTTTITPTTTTTTLPEAAAPKGGWFVKGGYFAGGGRVCFGYELSLNPSFNAALDLGYGAGENFSVASVGGSLIYPLSRERSGINPYLGLEANYSDFSKRVVDVLLANDIPKGGGAGVGVILGISRDNLFLHTGLDSRAGLIAEGGLRL
ncbi:hypothetical protein ACFL37_02240, partial [Candidatus Margulisiibacteriota bacterium]